MGISLFQFGLRLQLTVTSFALLGANSVFGQEPSTMLEPIVLEPIVIEGGNGETAPGEVKGYVAKKTATVSKTDADIMETPQAVNVISTDQMADQDVKTLSEAVRYTPGVTAGFYGGGDTRDDPISVRGFSANQFWDGLIVPGGYSYAATRPEPYGLSRIEILKGPASVLYGQSSPGGLVNMVSKRPTEEARGEIILDGGLGAGSFERLQGQFDISGPVNADQTLLYRFVGLARDANTMVDDQPDNRMFLAPSFTWKPTEDTTITWLNHYSKDRGGVFQQLPMVGTLLPNPNGILPISRNAGEPGYDRFEAEYATTGYILEHQFSDTVKFSQSARYGRYRDDYAGIYINGLQNDLRTVDRSAYEYGVQIDGFSIDNRLALDFETGAATHSALIGLDYTSTRYGRQDGQVDAPPIDIFDPVYLGFSDPVDRNNRIASKNWDLGLYAQDVIRFGDLTVMAGIRHDWAEDQTTELDTSDPASESFAEQNPSATTYRIGAAYQFDNGFAPYASYSESFQLSSGADAEGDPFLPTTGQQYEVGLRYAFPDYDAMITLSAFDLYQQNVKTPDPDDPFEEIQTGEVNVRGIELEAKASLDNWNFTGGVSYMDGRVSRTTLAGQLGMQAAQTPTWLASLWVDYIFDRDSALGGLTLGGGVRHVGSYYSFQGAPEDPKVPETTLFDAHLKYDFGAVDKKYDGLSLNVTATNVFNERTYAAVYPDFATYGPGREITASLAYRW